MRLWSLHPKYLDKAGLVACWREGLLAQSVLLKGEYITETCFDIESLFDTKKIGQIQVINSIKKKTPYWNHPQLQRFKNEDIKVLGYYLSIIWYEAKDRGYKFDITKIPEMVSTKQLTVTRGQLEYEFNHLMDKLKKRNYNLYRLHLTNICQNDVEFFNSIGKKLIEPHPLFKVVEGEIEAWERIKTWKKV